ncbi:hypothetical protein CEUSTIGMA_g6705.t1 [Chlamydomonas eustigma]|uniref:Uncharacterized protein n=1 Tax=Chlamydomonas eustigma TaxID=1157962 RepID=A0A250X870_9CHLO|nr:hypothetical protein CEUSTIGMA_g6705.t1 [Chlamydomonas eustigma]|eukprot:GAX79265.1 hypothetical protein CEUSTIGMA_g6705.t1 [Chlamydomonas eustigma]
MSNEDCNEDQNDRHLCKESDLEESDCSVDIPRSERKHRLSVFEFIDRTMATAHASKWVKDRFDACSDKDVFFPTMPGLMCQTLEFFEMTLELGEYKGRVVYEAFAARHREASVIR